MWLRKGKWMHEKIVVGTPEEALEKVFYHDFYIIKVKTLAGSDSEWLKVQKPEVRLNGDILKIGYTSFPFRLIEEITIRYCDDIDGVGRFRETFAVKVSAEYLNQFLSEETRKALAKFLN